MNLASRLLAHTHKSRGPVLGRTLVPDEDPESFWNWQPTLLCPPQLPWPEHAVEIGAVRGQHGGFSRGAHLFNASALGERRAVGDSLGSGKTNATDTVPRRNTGRPLASS